MKNPKFSKVWLVTALLLSATLGIPFHHLSSPVAHASSSPESRTQAHKKSPDLEIAVSDRKSRRLVSVIIDTNRSHDQAFDNIVTRVNQLGGTIDRRLSNDSQLAVRVPADVVDDLANDQSINYVSLDREIQVTGHLETTTGAAQARQSGVSEIDGSGIGVAILDSGIYAEHHAFKGGRIVASVDFTGEGRTDDPYGHGTHVAAVAAGNDHIAEGAYTGVAPGASIVNVRVLNSEGRGSVSCAIAGIDWCIANKNLYNIRVLNMSFGAAAVDSYVNDPLCLAVRRAFNAGLVVCAAAGNIGKDAAGNKVYGAIHSPGIEPSALTVGAANTFGTDARSDDGVATYSSRGPTRGYYTDDSGVKHYDNLIKPDLVAPGNKIIEAESPNNLLVTQNPSLEANVSGKAVHEMMYMSGTSMATPAVAGAAALVLQRNPKLTPNLVKAVLEYTAQPLAGFNTLEQGAGELNAEGAVRLAGLIRPHFAKLNPGDSLLIGKSPKQQTTIAGETFSWGQGIIQKWNFVYGPDLMREYQGIYGAGILLSDGVLLSQGILLSDGVLLSAGVLLSQGVILSNGSLLSDGVLLSAGAMLSDGSMLSDGAMLSDGTMLSDGYFAYSISPATSTAIAAAARDGDNGGAMSLIVEDSPLD